MWPVVVIVKYNFEDGLDGGTVLICRPELRALSTSNFYHLALRRRRKDLFISSVYSMVSHSLSLDINRHSKHLRSM